MSTSEGFNLRGQAAIVGVGELAPARYTEGETILGIQARASRLAVEDAGLEFQDIDGVLVQPSPGVPMLAPSTFAEYLGLSVTFAEHVDLGGAAGAGMVWRAAAAIATGMCTTCLCVTGRPRERADLAVNPWGLDLTAEAEFDVPYGAVGTNWGYACIANRYAHEFGLSDVQRATVAVKQRDNACMNPDAIFYGKPITVEDVLSSPMIVDPLRQLEIVMPTGGAAALVVTSAQRAKALRERPAYLLGAGEACTHKTLTYAPDITHSIVHAAADAAFSMAGVSRSQIGLASIYDCYTITALITLEDAGFCKKGQAGEFVVDHDLGFAGDFPMNTHGGQLSYGQSYLAGGMSHVTEAARQLHGAAGARQVADLDLAFVNGNGGVMSEQVSLVLGIEP
jgi:acetyl-CoA acetyltransferase